MTIHADSRRRYSRRRGRFDRRVTVTTVDAVIAYVVFMAELKWLLALDVLPGVPAGTSDLGRHPKRREKDKDRAEDRGSC